MNRTVAARSLPFAFACACWLGIAAPARALTIPQAAAASSAAAEPPSRAMLRELTSSPRLAGTSAQAWSADLVARWLEDAGWKVEIDRRQVLLSLPRNIAFSAFDSAFAKTPMFEHIDRFDPDAIPAGDLPKCNGWSASGDVRGLLVDAGYGQRADFERLSSLGVETHGTIALVRYGRCYRGVKVDLATQNGCIGVLLFDDPAEDGPARGPVWPEGPWKPDWDAQRGSISPIGRAPGDPSTPGWPSPKPGEADARRLSTKELDDALPRIPCIPIGSRDAHALQEKLASVETKDKDGKTRADRVGPGPVQVHLVVDQPRDVRTIHNVIARLPGASGRCVIAGAHRDAWVRGANDDGAGTVLMVRAAQLLGARAKAGWKPKSTIVVCLWDAEEFGMIGSTEWGEANADIVARDAIAYLNADTGVNGPHFRGASGTPGLLGVLRDVLQRIPAAPVSANSAIASAPESKPDAAASESASASVVHESARNTTAKTLWDEWLEGARTRAHATSAEPRLSLPGSGSDFAVFLHHLSVPVLQFGFGDAEAGQYHTTFDDFNIVDRYIDPGFVGHELAGRFVAELLAEIAERGTASFDAAEAANALSLRAREVADEIEPEPSVPANDASAASNRASDASATSKAPSDASLVKNAASDASSTSNVASATTSGTNATTTGASSKSSDASTANAASKSASDAHAASKDAGGANAPAIGATANEKHTSDASSVKNAASDASATSNAASSSSDQASKSATHLDPAAERLAHALRQVSDELAGLASALSAKSAGAATEKLANAPTDRSTTASTAKPATESSHTTASSSTAKSSARAVTFYSALALPEGLPGRAWYRNRLWTPGLEDGYGSETFPTLRAAAKESAAALEHEVDSLVGAIRKLRSEIAPR